MAAYYMNLISTNLGQKGERYFKQFVEQIPVPKISNQKIGEIVRTMLQKSNSPADICALEKEKNRLIYKIYQLTEEEIKSVKARIAEK